MKAFAIWLLETLALATFLSILTLFILLVVVVSFIGWLVTEIVEAILMAIFD